MEQRPLGRTGVSVSKLCLGAMMFGDWGTKDHGESIRIIHRALDAGINFIDTADVYSHGESEVIVGEALAGGRRDDVILATKVGKWAKRPGLKAANIIAACEDSLKRLQTDTIDLYQSHADDAETPQDETLEAYGRLIAAGKVRAIGASNFDATRLEASLRIAEEGGFPHYVTLQPLYNLIDREFEKALQPLCVDEEIGVIPYYSLASGFLTGKYRSEADLDKSPRGKGVAKYLDAKGQRILAALDEVAGRTGATHAELALAWINAQPGIAGPISSATSLDQLASLIRGARLTLDKADLDLLTEAGAGN